MPKTWFTSDFHFNHKLMAELRGMQLEEMNEMLISKYNGRVKDEDTVFILGDVAFRTKEQSPKDFISRLNGKKIMVSGNHDSHNSIDTRLYGAVVKIGGFMLYLVHRPSDFNQNYEINLVGHIHTAWKIKVLPNGTKLVNVGVDVWDYMPVEINEILSRIQLYEKTAPRDHHNEVMFEETVDTNDSE